LEINTPLRIVILAPSVLFFVTILWSLEFRFHLQHRIERTLGHSKKNQLAVGTLLDFHLTASLFAEAAILFLVNGLTVILVLEDQASGVIQMSAGIIFSMSGLIWVLTHEGMEHKTGTGMIRWFSLLVGFVTGQVWFLILYGQFAGTTLSIVMPWIEFMLLFPVTSYLVYRGFIFSG
jgi:hypothetical protein